MRGTSVSDPPIEPATVRPARTEDAERLLAIFGWLMEPPGVRPDTWRDAASTAALQRVIASASSAALIAELDGDLVGGCTVYVDIVSVRFGQRAWIEDLAVHPEHRSRGIGTLLLATAKAWAREHGATHLELESAEVRHDAHRFYLREGAARVSRCFWWKL